SEARFGGLISKLISWRYPRSLVVSPSQGVADDLEQRFNVRRTRVIPHGVDAENIRALAEENVDGELPSVPYIVACGRLTAANDYPTPLRACAIARDGGLRDPLVIVGDGEERPELEKLIDELKL